MPKFEFDEGAVAAVNYNNTADPTFSDTITLTENEVTFSWGVETTDGRTSIKHEPSGRFGRVRDYLEAKNVSGSPPGDKFTLASPGNEFTGTELNPIRLDLKSVVGPVQVQFFGASDTSTQIVNSAGTVTAEGVISEIVFTTAGEFRIESLETEVNCFLEGTRLKTPNGDRPIELLCANDEICLAGGGTARIAWIARQRIVPRFHPPTDINPICILAGALAEGVPERNLYLTQDHALMLEGMLINAGSLINGQTIYQVPDMPSDGFDYYHVELDTHQVILAESAETESFVDYKGRDAFDTIGAHPDPQKIISEMPVPRIVASRMVPKALVARLQARADIVLSRPQSAA